MTQGETTMTDGARKPSTKSSVRTCVGCGASGSPADMVRFLLGPEGPDGAAPVAVDAADGGFGRGAHAHPACIPAACKGGFARAFRCKVAAEPAHLAAELRAAYERRVLGLLSGARRSGHLAIGVEPTVEAMTAGAPLVVLATDAAAVAARFESSVREGRAVAFGTRASLGALSFPGREGADVAALAVTHEDLAREVGRCVRLVSAAPSATSSRGAS
jgi:predicted RNA-binding protein YlxR (DUF448 family)